MIANDIREALQREPFEPFRIVTASGESFAVRDPQAVALMESRAFVTLPHDRWTLVPFAQITTLESINGARAPRRGKRSL